MARAVDEDGGWTYHHPAAPSDTAAPPLPPKRSSNPQASASSSLMPVGFVDINLSSDEEMDDEVRRIMDGKPIKPEKSGCLKKKLSAVFKKRVRDEHDESEGGEERPGGRIPIVPTDVDSTPDE